MDIMDLRTVPDHILIYTCIDRITGEEVPLFINTLMEKGAKNVNLVPAIGKKGRSVYLGFIDFKKELMNEITETLVFQFNITGWHIFHTSHEFVHVENKTKEIKILCNKKEIIIPVAFKLIRGKNGLSQVLLEHDECRKYYDQNMRISFSDFKSLITSEIYKDMK